MRMVVCSTVAWCLAAALVAAEIPPESAKKHEQILYPVARVTVGNSGGSGTVIYSEDRGDGCQTYVLTNYHVIAEAIKVKTEWSSLLQLDVKKEVNDEVTVEIFRYDNGSRQDFTDACKAEIVAHDRGHDLALLRLKTSRKIPHVAKLLPENVGIRIFDRIWACGCSLLHPPVVTEGMINYLDDVIDNKVYWMGSAQIIFGNSGGAVFYQHQGDYYFIGVPSRVAGTWGQVVTHMGWFVPITRIRQWAKDEHLDFLFDSKSKPSECFQLRDKLRKEAEQRKPASRPEEPTLAPQPRPDRTAGP